MIQLKLKNILVEKGISVSQLSKATDIRYATIHNIVNNKELMHIDLSYLSQICTFLNIEDMNEIFSFVGRENLNKTSDISKSSIGDENYFADDELGEQKQRGYAQQIFAKKIKTIYNFKCAVTGISTSDFLVASHIIPWSIRQDVRLDPQNGICLSTFFNTAFDKGYITFDDKYSLVISSEIQKDVNLYKYFKKYEGKTIFTPEKLPPKQEYIKWHRNNLFFK